ncbi:hypothetical protein PQX77_018149 [Marasmius sp. AFHP31]|nr:hypothetical protein PQX77_018149 [Marasmius sp. AFHP31]
MPSPLNHTSPSALPSSPRTSPSRSPSPIHRYYRSPPPHPSVVVEDVVDEDELRPRRPTPRSSAILEDIDDDDDDDGDRQDVGDDECQTLDHSTPLPKPFETLPPDTGKTLYDELTSRTSPAPLPSQTNTLKHLEGCELWNPVPTARRDPHLPDLFLVNGAHPKRSKELLGLGRDFVYPWHSRDEKKIKEFEAWVEQDINKRVPKGPNARMPELGLYELEPGDIVWARDLDAQVVGPQGDWMQVYVVTPNEFYQGTWQKIVKRLKKVRDRGLGAKSLRTVAQVAFEKSERAVGIKKKLRCYPTAMNVQKSRNLALPAANVKLTVNDTIDDPEKTDDYLQLVRELNDVVVPLAVQAYRMRLPGQYRIMRDMADLMNTPRIACSENCLYTGGQLNIALAQLHESTEVLKELGFFGGVHRDQFDAAANMSNMTCCSDLPEGYEGGRFHFVELGVYIKLDGIQLIGFSGLRYHGGTPPLAPQGEELDPSAYRFVHILYPQSHVLDGRVTFNLAAQPNHQPMEVTGDIRIAGVGPKSSQSSVLDFKGTRENMAVLDSGVPPELEDGTAYSNDINFMYDGRLLMTAEDLFQFANRNLFLANNFVHQQQLLGADYTVDYDQFRRAFKYKGKHPEPWPLAPSGTFWEEPSLSMEWAELNGRQRAKLAYQLLCASNARFIPAIYDKYRDIINPIRGSPSTGVVIEDEGAMDDDSGEDEREEDKEGAVEKHQPRGDIGPVRGRPVKKGTRTKNGKGNGKGSRKSNRVDDDVRTMMGKVASKVLSDPLGEKARQAKEDVGRRRKREAASAAEMVERELLVSSSDEREVEAERMDQDAQDGDAVMDWEPRSRSRLSPSPGVPSDHDVEMEEATPAQQPHTANERHVPRSPKEAILGTKSNGKRAKSTKSKNKKKVTYTPSIITGFREKNGKYAFFCQLPDKRHEKRWVGAAGIVGSPALNDFLERHHLNLGNVGKRDDPLDEVTDAHICTKTCLGSRCHPDLDYETPRPQPANLMNVLAVKDDADVGEDEPEDEEMDLAVIPESAWPTHDCVFFESLHSNVVANTLSLFQSAGSGPLDRKLVQSIAQTWTCMQVRPHDAHTVVKVAKAAESMKFIAASSNSIEVDSKLARWFLLMYHFVLAAWVTEIFNEKFNKLATSGTTASSKPKGCSSWLHDLIEQVHVDLLSNSDTDSLSYCSSRYLPSLDPPVKSTPKHPKFWEPAMTTSPGGSRVLEPRRRKQASSTIASNEVERIQSVVLSVVCDYIGLPPLAYVQGQFLLSVVKNLGFGALVLDPVYDAYQNPGRLTAGSSKSKFPGKERLAKVDALLSQHPYAQPRYYVQLDQIRTLMQNRITQDGAALHDLPNIPSNLTDHERQRFLDFLRSTLKITPGVPPDGSPCDLPQHFLERAFRELDSWLPARNKAPSRAQILREDGPFDPRYCRTRGQLFSALIFRGILFNTHAIHNREHTFHFPDLESWHEFCGPNPSEEEKRQLCNPRAYGQPMAGREIGNAEGFWEDALVLEQELNRDGDTLRPFGEVVDLINNKIGLDGKRDPKRFRTFGSLCAYLLCADLADAGAIAHPSIEELADEVCKVGKGCCAMLRSLGCPNNSASYRSEFIKMYEFLDGPKGLSAEEKRHLGWNGFVLEHGGCKFIRFYPMQFR